MDEKKIYRLLRLFLVLLSYLPFQVGQFIGKILGTAVSFIPMQRARVSLENIRQCKGNLLSRDDPRRLNRKVFVHFGQMLFEVPHILRMHKQNLERYVSFEKQENYTEAFKKGKGVLILTAHFGNWELMSVAVSIRFGGGAVVIRPFDFKPLNRLMNDLRARLGHEMIEKQRAIRRIIAVLKKNKAVGILLDQNVDWYDGAFVDFLGRMACTNKGLAIIALKTGSPVIPCFAVRQRDGRYRVIFEDEIKLIRTGDKRIDVEENTALFNRAIEKYIRRYPDQWFWFHKRWKTRSYCVLPEGSIPSRQSQGPIQ